MPPPNNPDAADFYVYVFAVNGFPFYVGAGRSTRAADRLRYVKRLMAREKNGKPAQWQRHTRVMRALMERGIIPQLHYVLKGVTRAVALQREREIIARLRAEGRLLANRHHNRGGASVDDILAAIELGDVRHT
jgi:hypothetical protein